MKRLEELLGFDIDGDGSFLMIHGDCWSSGCYAMTDEQIGEIPKAWNWLASEHGESKDAKLIHYTAGIPAWPAYAESAHADDWEKYAVSARHAV